MKQLAELMQDGIVDVQLSPEGTGYLLFFSDDSILLLEPTEEGMGLTSMKKITPEAIVAMMEGLTQEKH